MFFPKMKILQVIPNLESGGAERFVYELSNELCRQNHHVDILTLYEVPIDNPLRKGLNPGICIHSLNKKKGIDLKALFNVWKYAKKGKYDIVHGHVNAITYLIISSFLCRKARHVATIHSEASFEAGNKTNKWARKIMFSFKTCVPVTISEESEYSFEAFYGKKGIMISNGISDYIPQKQIQLRDHEKQIVFLHPASCQPIKNQQLLFTAFSKLLDEGYDAKIVWVGNNKSYYSLYKSLQPLMKRNVLFLGLVENVRDYMVAADAMCLSSEMEGMPMTIIEAFSVGCIPLCTPVGGIRNMIINKENGLLCKDLTTDAYYQMLKVFCDMPKAERTVLKSNAKESFPKYSIYKCARKYLDLFKELRPQ